MNNKNIKIRLFIIYILISGIGFITLGRIIHLMAFKKNLYNGTAQECVEESLLESDEDCNCIIINDTVFAERGCIYDANHRKLAEDLVVIKEIGWDAGTYINNYINNVKREASRYKKTSFDMADSLKMIDSVKYLINEASKELANILYYQFPNQDSVYYHQKFNEALSKKLHAMHKKYVTVMFATTPLKNSKKWITSQDISKIKQIELFKKRGLSYRTDTLRFKQYKNLASTTIGNVNENGLEYRYDSLLSGNKGYGKSIIVNHVEIPMKGSVKALGGCDIHSTINIDLQKIVEDTLMSRLISQNAAWGTAVVMETETGYVRAIANLVRNTDVQGVNYIEGGNNYALKELCEPGSTFKLISLLVYLQNIENDTAKIYPIGAHKFQYGKGSYIRKDTPKSFEESGKAIMAFQRSSNVGIASMIFDVCKNKKDYLQQLDRLGITQTLNLQIKGTQQPKFNRDDQSFASFFNCTHGVGIRMAPIQTLTFFNAVANGGKLIAPSFVTEIFHHNDIIEEYKPQVINPQFCSKEIIQKAQKYLEAVVYGPHGTARKFQSPKVSFAGKTGTRDWWNSEKGEHGDYEKGLNNVSFCGYFPIQNPKYSCIIYISKVALKSPLAIEVFRGIAEKITEFESDEKMMLPENDTTSYQTFISVPIISIKDIKTIYEKLGYESKYFDSIPEKYNYVSLKAINQEPYIKAFPVQNIFKEKIPNVIGMNARDAVAILNQKKYKVVIKGRGKVIHQYYKKGIVYIELNGAMIEKVITTESNLDPPPLIH